MNGKFLVMDKAANMPSSCWGTYRRVAVVELEPGFDDYPKMISTRARGVKRVVKTWERRHVGTTSRCAFERALSEALDMARALENSA